MINNRDPLCYGRKIDKEVHQVKQKTLMAAFCRAGTGERLRLPEKSASRKAQRMIRRTLWGSAPPARHQATRPAVPHDRRVQPASTNPVFLLDLARAFLYRMA